MDRKHLITIFLIVFVGTCGVISVDKQCREVTGMGGKTGLTLTKTAEGNLSFCFFGLEGEIGL